MTAKQKAPKSLMLEDLKRSGLTKEDAVLLKLKLLTKIQTNNAVNKKAIAYKIPYFNINGTQSKFYRVRLLKETGFAASSKKKPQRYTQPAGTQPHLYFPPYLNWKKYLADPSLPLLITEGEKKAAKAAKEGVPCIGLGGVWSFRSSKELKPLIDDFKDIIFEERDVQLIFDSDLKNNPDVLMALYTLANELTAKGAYVYMGFLNDAEDGSKVGLDDYIVERGIDALKDIECDDYQLSKELWQLNNELAFVTKPVSVYHFKTKQLITRDTLTTMLMADRIFITEIDGKMRKLNASAEWLKWSNRKTYEGLVYSPGDSTITDNKINSWEGWGVTPKRGSVKIWLEFLDYFFKSDPEFRAWFEQWVAYPLQHPGAKMYTCVMLHGLLQGTGKTFIGYILGRIYGNNYSEVNQEDIHNDFNTWMVGKQFVQGEEITGNDRRRDADHIKTMITRSKIIVNNKYQPIYEIRDCINYIFTSNHPDAFFIEIYDRRYAVFEAPNYLWENEKYNELDDFKNDTAKIAALFHHLLYKVDTSSFDPRRPAPITHAKQNMQALSMSDLDVFANALREDPDGLLVLGNVKLERDLYALDEIIRLYDPDGQKRTAGISLSKALVRAGFIRLKMTKTASGTKRLWALRNQAKWLRSCHTERVADYDKAVVPMAGRGKKFK